jgi:hypothetical protein
MSMLEFYPFRNLEACTWTQSQHRTAQRRTRNSVRTQDSGPRYLPRHQCWRLILWFLSVVTALRSEEHVRGREALSQLTTARAR